MTAADEKPIWTPSQERIDQCNLTAFMRAAEERHGVTLPDYDAVYNWSVDQPEDFWSLLWDFCGIVGEKGARIILDGDKMPGARFFPDAKLNFAENLLRRRDDSPAMIFWCEDWLEKRCHVSWNALYDETSRIAQALKAAGVTKGDRVAGFIPNIPEAVSAFLAAASLGAIWTSCSPDFGIDGVLDRFEQTTPKVIFATDGYRFNGKDHDTMAKLAGVVDKLDCVEKVVVVPYLNDAPDLSAVRGATTLADFVAPFAPAEIDFLALPFDHPIYILYSSGTTGKPKCIVHAAGGVLIQHLKEQKVLFDIKPGDRMFYFTTLTWMMWNWLVSNLASEATLMLYEGAPTYPSPEILFDYAQDEKITVLGLSAKFIDGINKAGLAPIETHDLSSIKTIMSTGSPLVEESYDYVYAKIAKDIQLSSASGGTDLAACFVGGNPIGPIWRGEIQAPTIGMRMDIFDPDGKSLREQQGELVCTQSFPSMPIRFLNDESGERYHDAYFAKYPNVWTQGDWAEITRHGGFVIYGRSDATLNPGGVRIGTAEIYRQVERIHEVEESIVVGQRWQNDTRVILFVRLRPGIELSDDLIRRIRKQVKEGASPRHVPAKILQVTDIPRTRSGKITELAVRDVIHGNPVKNTEALDNPQALALYENLPELQE